MSTNTIYPELADSVYIRYAKVPLHIVSGIRVDPHDPKSRVAWILKTDTSNYNLVTKERTFVYEDEVIELYSKLEHDVFLRVNANLIKNGLLKQYDGEASSVDSTNTVSDAELASLVSIRSNQEFEEKISGFDSVHTLTRLKQIAIEAGKSVKRVQLIESRIEAVDGDS